MGYQSSEGGYFTIVSKLSQMALDVWEFSMENDGDIRQWHFTGNANQQWQFKRISQSEEVGEPKEYPLEGEIFGVHDPVMIKTDLGYYVFSTGEGILSRHSTDKQSWNFLGHLLKPLPQWVLDRFGDIHIWAPDVAKFAGQYHLYYSVSEFGKNRSCIGLLINDSEDLSRGWKDSGEPVICTSPSDDWNAIDANIAFDEYGTPWMSIGSFWSGLKILRLDGATGMPADHGITSIATRLTSGRAIEAPFIHYNNGYYYLFVSFDYCCKGADSTYRIMVGRSKNIDGPYYDKSGRSMLQGGGSLLLQSGDRWRGPGHNAIFAEGESTYLVFHAYDRDANGLFSLKIADIIWDQDGWPKTISLD
ncbi:family 43 glycosylhydrolase [Pseudobacteriovorax antillogorgiicola]|uniref:Arabinan endo-1,5-alpha-L-arabinosidase n=1 Tax=Pseudobacteriovorax antillogorgiicola TaxID=1513793 RepID=A0A1Y6CQS4_9BACT|nr:family 43 glycosylhydrolase [Pseudobacteriovorax antillogorgiicola]TCS42124.1 arabinan endo-1,5-alpha-L-arabinosidase [Pseudobacteriovorax antillogorgiicola]SMF82990.1 arabinan endo-1,5-alpha-L-arabinosidase [Pseudobacteriovorax antillogorgiicola]